MPTTAGEPLPQFEGGQTTPSAIPPLTTTQRPARRVSCAKIRTGRFLSVLATAFLVFDVLGKFVMPNQVTQAFVRLGFPVSLSVAIGAILLVCTAIYAFPRTAAFGALLLTGYLGGAVAIQWRAGSPVFETVFPVLLAVLVWAGVFLREDRLWAIFPVRR